MVIWLRLPNGHVGLGEDVVRAHELAHLVELDRASGHFERLADDLLAKARLDAEALRNEAQAQAQLLLDAAQTKYDNAGRLGYEAGRRRALQDAHEAMMRGAASRRALLFALRERIADLVMRTAVRVLGEADREALFAHVAATLTRHLDEVSFLTVRVAPDDVGHAQQAFRRVCDAQRWPLNPEIEVDPDAQPGGCVCEWDHGVIEGGLPLQLRALESAIRQLARAADEGACADGPTGDDALAAYDDEDTSR